MIPLKVRALTTESCSTNSTKAKRVGWVSSPAIRTNFTSPTCLKNSNSWSAVVVCRKKDKLDWMTTNLQLQNVKLWDSAWTTLRLSDKLQHVRVGIYLNSLGPKSVGLRVNLFNRPILVIGYPTSSALHGPTTKMKLRLKALFLFSSGHKELMNKQFPLTIISWNYNLFRSVTNTYGRLKNKTKIRHLTIQYEWGKWLLAKKISPVIFCIFPIVSY